MNKSEAERIARIFGGRAFEGLAGWGVKITKELGLETVTLTLGNYGWKVVERGGQNEIRLLATSQD